ncbi:Rid family hydrolase [Polymorphospora sp. NPDC050346]|uniref:RidA family protein n=1 Tax=Polymorphospora sp. NPDC050346 TaxID=3155780 RepID=UPI0033D0314A
MSDRVSIEIDGIGHGDTPIPMACRVANVIFSSGIPGRNPADGRRPDDPEQEVEFAFGNVAAVIRRAGADVDDVAEMTVLVSDESIRPLVDPYWVRMFPDSASRPARHTTVQQLRGGARIQLRFVAVVGRGNEPGS